MEAYQKVCGEERILVAIAFFKSVKSDHQLSEGGKGKWVVLGENSTREIVNLKHAKTKIRKYGKTTTLYCMTSLHL